MVYLISLLGKNNSSQHFFCRPGVWPLPTPGLLAGNFCNVSSDMPPVEIAFPTLTAVTGVTFLYSVSCATKRDEGKWILAKDFLSFAHSSALFYEGFACTYEKLMRIEDVLQFGNLWVGEGQPAGGCNL
jgi:hypothetical protein